MKTADWAVLGLGTLAFLPALASLAQVWSSVDYLSHGFLIPVVAGFIALSRRGEWRTLEGRRDARGLLAVGAALGVSLVGLLAGHPTTTGIGVVLGALGAVLALGGAPGVALMRFPLAYLVFMVPPPASWTTPIVVALQLWVSSAAVFVLRLFGLAILREGNVIVLPGDAALFVDEACSGITSVVTLVPLGVLLAWATERTRLRRLVLVACVVPAAMLGNFVRVTLTVWASARWGADVATSGFVHSWAGVGTYVLACGALLGVSAVLRRVEG